MPTEPTGAGPCKHVKNAPHVCLHARVYASYCIQADSRHCDILFIHRITHVQFTIDPHAGGVLKPRVAMVPDSWQSVCTSQTQDLAPVQTIRGEGKCKRHPQTHLTTKKDERGRRRNEQEEASLTTMTASRLEQLVGPSPAGAASQPSICGHRAG